MFGSPGEQLALDLTQPCLDIHAAQPTATARHSPARRTARARAARAPAARNGAAVNVADFPFVVTRPSRTGVDPPRRGNLPRCWRNRRRAPISIAARRGV